MVSAMRVLEAGGVADPRETGRRLREARRIRRLTQQEVAAQLGVSRPLVIAMEQGTRTARPEELTRLATLYGWTVHELTRPTPVVAGLAERLGLRPGEESHQALADAAGQAQRLAEDIVELYELSGTSPSPSLRLPAPYDTTGLRPVAAAEDIAACERQRLGLGDGPVPQLRRLLEDDVGLLVLAIDLPPRVTGLVGPVEPVGVCVAVNAAHPHERRWWALAHAYGHLTVDPHHAEVAYLPGHARAPAGERFAEAFAARFLMPGPGLARRFHALWRARGGSLTPADMLGLARTYQVPVAALVLRLEALGLVPARTWASPAGRGFQVGAAPCAAGSGSPLAKADLLPLRVRYLACEAHLAGLLSEGELARLLRTDRRAARELVRKLSHSVDVGEEGGGVELEIDPEHYLATS